MTDDRKIPSNLEAEQGVIGGVLVSPSEWAQCSDLAVDDFLLPAHRVVWEAIRGLVATGSPIDVLLLVDALTASGEMGRLDGGAAFLTGLNSASWNVVHYATRVREAAGKRRLLAALSDVVARIYAGEEDLGSVVAAARTALDKASSNVGSLVAFKDLAQPMLDEFEERAKREETFVTGVRFGIDRLDNLTAGLQPGWLVIVAAETGGGKTALAMQAAIDCVLRGGTALAVNLEMTRTELAERAVVHVAEMNSQLVRLGQIAHDDWKALTAASDKLCSTAFYFEDGASAMPQILGKARMWRAKHRDKLGLLVVDFVQLIRSARERGQSRAQEIGIFAQDLKALAKELKVPVILISQLNRAGVKADRPSKSDLKESGDLENAADLIVLPWNKNETSDGDVALIVDKFRSGEKLTIPARWVGRHYRFTNSDVRDWREAFDGAA